MESYHEKTEATTTTLRLHKWKNDKEDKLRLPLFYQQLFCQIFVTQTVHIGNTFANQFKGFGVVEKVQSLLVCQVRLSANNLTIRAYLRCRRMGLACIG
ncbi:MAG: hypothetical protein K2I99_08590 [Bacteroidaceae bacterium]|nr:hypothetical protein [Bacteroidaceae bacterium]